LDADAESPARAPLQTAVTVDGAVSAPEAQVGVLSRILKKIASSFVLYDEKTGKGFDKIRPARNTAPIAPRQPRNSKFMDSLSLYDENGERKQKSFWDVGEGKLFDRPLTVRTDEPLDLAKAEAGTPIGDAKNTESRKWASRLNT